MWNLGKLWPGSGTPGPVVHFRCGRPLLVELDLCAPAGLGLPWPWLVLVTCWRWWSGLFQDDVPCSSKTHTLKSCKGAVCPEIFTRSEPFWIFPLKWKNYALSLGKKSRLLVSLCFLKSLGSAGISYSSLDSDGGEWAGWCYRGSEGKRGRNWKLTSLFLPTPLFSPRNPNTNLFHADTFQPHADRALWVLYLLKNLDTSESQWGAQSRFNLGSPWCVPLNPGVTTEPQNVTGEGIISLFSYLQGRTVLKPSQTDG